MNTRHNQESMLVMYKILCFFSSRLDAALTCPEPWSHVNRSIKLLEMHVCHLTQFAFFFSFYVQNGLILFDKNHTSKYFTI